MAKLTQHQIALLTAHVTPNRPAHPIMRWLDNGSIVEFTDPSFTYSNAEFSINYDSSHKIWFSQIANFGLDDNLELVCCNMIFQNGTTKSLVSMSVDDFWKDVQGKEFEVCVPDNILYVFNKNSDVWSKEGLYNYKEAWEFVVKCAENEQYSKIGDLIKPGSIYALVEK